MTDLPLAGLRVGVTASRKVEEQVELLERRGAETVWAPALALGVGRLDDVELRAETARVLSRPVDVFLANTGFGLRAWFAALEEWGALDDVVAALGRAEILARGAKGVGALRQHGLREAWSAPREELDELVRHLDGRDLTGLRVVVQEHGQPSPGVVEALTARGADVVTLTIYRTAEVADDQPLRALVEQVATRGVHAVTFTAAPAAHAFLALAEDLGRDDAVASAFREGVLACCVGPVTAAAFDGWDVPTTYPERSRLAAMVKHLETELTAARAR